MDLRKKFAHNLRLECKRFESIEHVCRGVSINRQQFNKYLAGDHLPRLKTIKRLCEFLGVAEETLFRDPSSGDELITKPLATNERQIRDEFNKLVTSNVLSLNGMGYTQSREQLKLRDGLYFCYFPLQNFPEMLVRSVISLKSKNGCVTFVRHTFFRSAQFPLRTYSKGRHLGVVISSRAETYFVATSTVEPHHLSLITLSNAQSFPGDVLVGLGLTRAANQAFASRVCMEYLGNTTSIAKRAAQAAGLVKRQDKSVHPLVSLTLAPSGENHAGQVSLPEIEKMLMNKPDLTNDKPSIYAA